jgi:hypothetical protein
VYLHAGQIPRVVSRPRGNGFISVIESLWLTLSETVVIDYNRPASVFMESPTGRGRPLGYRAFRSAAEAIRFAVEERRTTSCPCVCVWDARLQPRSPYRAVRGRGILRTFVKLTDSVAVETFVSNFHARPEPRVCGKFLDRETDGLSG